MALPALTEWLPGGATQVREFRLLAARIANKGDIIPLQKRLLETLNVVDFSAVHGSCTLSIAREEHTVHFNDGTLRAFRFGNGGFVGGDTLPIDPLPQLMQWVTTLEMGDGTSVLAQAMRPHAAPRMRLSQPTDGPLFLRLRRP